MKAILVCFFIGCCFGCDNPKAKIVEQEKEIKERIALLQPKEDSIASFDVNLIGKSTPKNPYDTAGIHERLVLGKNLQDSIKLLKWRYDSLEMELKKY